MILRIKTVPRILGLTGIAALIVAAIPGTATAAPTGFGGNHTCTGTSASPGTLAGNFANVTIAGTCLVDAGNVNIAGNLTVAKNASLVADFGQNDQTDSGKHSRPLFIGVGSDGGLPVRRSRLCCGRGVGVVAGTGFGDDSVA
jgi:hypothetical protein